MNTTLTKQEADFLFNTLIPLNLDSLVEGEQKSKIQLFLDAHNPQKFTPLTDRLDYEGISIDQHFEKAFKDTVNFFFLEKRASDQKKYFSMKEMYDLKDKFLYLLKFNSFYHIDKRTISIQLYLFLNHLYQTFQTLENYDWLDKKSYGTAFMTSNYRDGLSSHLKFIQRQLNTEESFSVITDFEKDRLVVSRFSVKTFRNHTDIANLMLTLNAMYSFDVLKLDMREGQKAGFKQSYSTLNGLKTSKRELIQSFMIKTYFPYYHKEKIHKQKLTDITLDIAKYFFPDLVLPKDNGKQNQIGLSPRVFKHKLYIKTALDGNPIYAYDRKKEYTYLFKGTIEDALKTMRKIYLELGHSDIVENPLFDKAMKKILINPIYPL